MGKFSEAVISPLVSEMTECVQREQRVSWKKGFIYRLPCESVRPPSCDHVYCLTPRQVKEELEVERREAQAELEELQGLQAVVER